MIKDESQRQAILESFPAVTLGTQNEIEQDIIPQYIFYKTVSKTKKECFCTHCRQKYETNGVIHHKENGNCEKCGYQIKYHSSGRGRGVLECYTNVCVMHAIGDDLYVRCFKVWQEFIGSENIPNVIYDEKYRYYLTKGAAQRWESNWRSWYSMKSENEPTFTKGGFYGANNSYVVVGEKELEKTFLKYSQLEMYVNRQRKFGDRGYYISYLCLYAKHPNIEYLMKTGFGRLVDDALSGRTCHRINWRTNDVKKMLKLNKIEMNALEGMSSNEIACYVLSRKILPSENVDNRIEFMNEYRYELENIKYIVEKTGLSWEQIFNYNKKQTGNVKRYDRFCFRDWKDYISECIQLGYDVHDSAISKPKDLPKAHNRTSKLIVIKANEESNALVKKRAEVLKKLQFSNEKMGLAVVIPRSIDDIVNEGKVLDHCVGGYADRHVKGKLNILFVRKLSELDKPYYTMEVSTDGRIIQCRGYKNNWNSPKTQDVIDFENEYQAYLDTIFKQNKRRKTA